MALDRVLLSQACAAGAQPEGYAAGTAQVTGIRCGLIGSRARSEGVAQLGWLAPSSAASKLLLEPPERGLVDTGGRFDGGPRDAGNRRRPLGVEPGHRRRDGGWLAQAVVRHLCAVAGARPPALYGVGGRRLPAQRGTRQRPLPRHRPLRSGRRERGGPAALAPRQRHPPARPRQAPLARRRWLPGAMNAAAMSSFASARLSFPLVDQQIYRERPSMVARDLAESLYDTSRKRDPCQDRSDGEFRVWIIVRLGPQFLRDTKQGSKSLDFCRESLDFAVPAAIKRLPVVHRPVNHVPFFLTAPGPWTTHQHIRIGSREALK